MYMNNTQLNVLRHIVESSITETENRINSTKFSNPSLEIRRSTLIGILEILDKELIDQLTGQTDDAIEYWAVNILISEEEKSIRTIAPFFTSFEAGRYASLNHPEYIKRGQVYLTKTENPVPQDFIA